MDLKFAAPLAPGDRIGVTAPSAGVGPRGQARIAFAIDWLRHRGYEVVVGECMGGDRWVSAGKQQRADELTAMLVDPTIKAVVPPWGGAGTALDLLDQLDYDAIAQADPTWVVGYSDSSTWMVPLTLRAGLATLHGDNLADTPLTPFPGLVHWTDFVASSGTVAQSDSHVVASYPPLTDSESTDWPVAGEGSWRLHGADRVDVTGTFIGGCIEVMSGIAGTPYGDVRSFGQDHGPLIVYLEACEENAYNICRYLHTLHYTGWFDHAAAVLIGRTNAPAGHGDDGDPGLSQDEAVIDALGDLGIPILLDLEIGHVPPHMPLLNGARAHVVVDEEQHTLTQSWL